MDVAELSVSIRLLFTDCCVTSPRFTETPFVLLANHSLSVVGETGSHAEIMRRITEANVVPPRQLNVKIPRDLETIVLKAIAADPANRFPTCKDLAEDLQRFIDGSPIHSRPVTSVERLWRWAKRCPLLATTTATSAFLLLLVAVIATLGYQAESEQRRRAEVTSAYAQEALETVFDRFAVVQHSGELLNDSSISAPVLSRESAQMLEGLLPIFDRLAELDEPTPDVRRRATEARKRLGDIQQRLGQFEQAIESYRLAAARYQSAEEGDAVKTALQLADIFNEIGTCNLMLGRIEEARGSHQQALRQLQPLTELVATGNPGNRSEARQEIRPAAVNAAKCPVDIRYQPTAEATFQLARTHFLLARRLRPGEGPNAREFAGPPAGPPRGPGGGGRPGPRHRPDRPDNRSRTYGGPGTPHDERRELHTAVRLMESLSDEQSQDPRCRHLLAMCLKRLSNDDFSGRSESEHTAENRALILLKELAAEFPNVLEYSHVYVGALASIDTRDRRAIAVPDLPDAEERLRRAIQGGIDLVARHPYVPDYTLTLIHAHNRLAHMLERRAWEAEQAQAKEFLTDALAAYQSAERLQAGLVTQFPDAEAYKSWLHEFERSASRVREELDRW